VSLTRQAVKDLNSEIVVVISNPGGTRARCWTAALLLASPCLGPHCPTPESPRQTYCCVRVMITV
jgi:hypothetical protein